MTDAKRPMAGHRSATSLVLVFGSVMPVTLGSILLWFVLVLPVDGYTFLLLMIGGLLATVAPYAVGWTRGVVSLLALTVSLRWLEDVLRDEWLGWRVAGAVAIAAALAALAWLSLRWGRVRRPADAKRWQEKHDVTWPYPYA